MCFFFFCIQFASYMEKRKPYQLKGILAVYNMFQVAACCYLIHGVSTFNPKIVDLILKHLCQKLLHTDSTVIQFWKCHSVNYKPDDFKAVTILQYTYLVFLLKLVELVETVFFVLRKKDKQISKLHVYHHVSTACLCWIMVKYNGGMTITLNRK